MQQYVERREERRDEREFAQGVGYERSNLPSIHQLLSSADPGPKVWRADCEVGVWRS